ncbi:sugar phosphate isomerase/epimerase [Virgibacillus sp. NKC19-3]|uniref:sugar phosphate isomerase/epimerase family protein n=1 Tax=Virgibacillus saliphilus TaxID=2831674 RepID=UPI001C9AACC2|nr:sugar phosphate isomerase/epimerase [Virgibacillus sp. NKC19-3]MBY7142823.1 sugar phosphate isomerase/epimerase [Virgibacillus sp. NKC19-3]
MNLGVFAVLFADRPIDKALDHILENGISHVEIGCGGYPGNDHCKPKKLLEDPDQAKKIKNMIRERSMHIDALSVHGNALHPNKDIGQSHHQDLLNTIKAANELEVDTVVTFAGCPGDSDNAHYPNWVTSTWPPDYRDLLEWQWTEKVIPYWQQIAEQAQKYGVKIAIEPHPGFVVYNTENMSRLRESVGETIGLNFDPSHLFWQQSDPIDMIKKFGKEQAIYHVHAKDIYLDYQNISVNGVLDTKPFSEILDRSWYFRTIGYGHGEEEWKKIISALQAVDYDGVISIEHEDALMLPDEGFRKAVNFLKNTLIREKNTAAIWWD